jgi:gluconolactonase
VQTRGGDLTVLATGLQFPEGPVSAADGSVFLVEIARGTVTRVTPTGGVEVFAETGGGPNGLAVGPDGAFYVCNNGGFAWRREPNGWLRPTHAAPDYTTGRIERVDPVTRKAERLYERCDGQALCSPNDLVFDAHGGFYFTDTGRFHDRSRDHGGLYYAKADGSDIVSVVYPLLSPNGVGLSPDGQTVYVAETEPGRLWAFDIIEPGVVSRLPFPQSMNGGRIVVGLGGFQRLDSLAVTAAGNVCLGTLISGVVTMVSPAGEMLVRTAMPDPYPTNICFGGADMTTAHTTLALTGQLVSSEWSEPGLRLNANS